VELARLARALFAGASSGAGRPAARAGRPAARAGRPAARAAGPPEGRSAGRVARRFRKLWAGHPIEAPLLAGILLLAAADRFVNLPARGSWNTDQGVEVGDIWQAVVTRQLPALGSPAFTTGGGLFHHGALFYQLMMPAAWLGNGDPTVLVFVIALFGLASVPMVWWVARSIGGVPSGLAAALLAAVAPSLIDYSTWIENPVLLQPGAALAMLGAWEAWHTRQPRWWVVAAAGTALASGSHLTALVLVFPVAALFLAALARSPATDRRRSRLIGWGLAGVGLFVLAWAPLIAYELTHDFAETRAILAFDQGGPASPAITIRLVVGTWRIVAWPFLRWPLVDYVPGAGLALLVAAGVVSGFAWRVAATFDPRRRAAMSADERAGIRLVAFVLGSVALVLILALGQISVVQNINQEYYHAVADVPVLLAAGLTIGGLWRVTVLGRRGLGQLGAVLALAALTAVSVAHWPPLTAPDGGWPAARAAADRLRADAAGGSIALVSLPAFKGAQAYGYPLTLDRVTFDTPERASTVVVLCDTGWYEGCGGTAEEQWVAEQADPAGLALVDRFYAAPDRVLSVYRRAPP
jgi:4-amino-4-deoxy-L-arabinose transferase-like glycosyltransferase